MVYDDAEKLYAEVRKDGKALLEEAFGVIFPDSVPLEPETQLKLINGSDDLVAFNTTFFPRRDVVKIPLGRGTASALTSKNVQASMDGKFGYTLAECSGGGTPGLLVPVLNNLDIACMPVSGAFYLY